MKKHVLRALAVGASFAVLAGGQTVLASDIQQLDAPQAEVTGGTIEGYYNEDGTVAVFKGIPYGADTGGENRWKNPQPVEEWEGIRDCTRFGPVSMQRLSGEAVVLESAPDMPAAEDETAAEPDSEAALEPETGETEESLSQHFMLNGVASYTSEYDPPEDAVASEDCLNLNVWTSTTDTTDKPVIVFIHGGGFAGGSSSCALYDGEAIAEEDAVFVSINYRVGIFGFLASSELAEEDEDGVAGNYAIRDCIAALQWVQENIEEFGGDPENVTIAGQSAGGALVDTLVASPKAEGLFVNALSESFPMADWGWSTQEEKVAEGDQLLAGVSIEDLRQMSSEEILNNYRLMSEAINIDGVYYPEELQMAFADGTANKVNYMTGMVNDDASMFFQWPSSSSISFAEDGSVQIEEHEITEEYWREVLEEHFGDLAEEALQAYPLDEGLIKGIDAFRNDMMQINTYVSAAAHALRYTDTNTYLYDFTWQIPNANYVFHSSEIGYFLNNFCDTRDWTEDDYRMGVMASSYLLNFARTGDPNGTDSEGAELPEWKAMDSETMIVKDLSLNGTYNEMTDAQKNFWDKVLVDQETYGDAIPNMTEVLNAIAE